ncbi:glycosyl transferase [Actinoplanes sp. ATCC 53533]|uniref:glycosyltransferase n=1 Tax=Actinoplanes sp. ATCC 53533 TaxID=1288362 RepID=UPI0003874D78|nr:glycosyltransferase [Actinoplanes sp. ATCC 53533]AGS77315.1 GtfC glycosyltransferase [Actinoplanes sp. ATCC 53533]RSM42871.1 glycosyl transferase [Actinoplanes sp. ATCC 53533]
MRVLLTTCGSRGDVEPLVALAVRLRALGVEVRMCAPPLAAERLAEVDVPLVPIGRAMRMMKRKGAPPSAEDERRMTTEAIAMQFDQVPPAAEGCDAVVTTGELSAAVAVRSVAEKLGIPYFYCTHAPVYLPSPHHPPPADERLTPGVTDNQVLWEQRSRRFCERFGEPVNSRRASIGLPPVENIFRYGNTDQPWMAADPILAPLQPGQNAVQTGAWILPDDRPLAAELEAFLAAGPPPVYVGFGSQSGTGDAATVAIAAIRAQGRRVILSRGWADLALPDDGADCLAVDETNLQALFGRVAAAVHHGSAGTTTVATRAGSPQIVIARDTDQPYFAERVAELGVGVAHDGPEPTFDSLSAALATALAPEVRARAAEVAGMIRDDGAAVAARQLLDAVSREKPAVSV